MEFTKSKLKLVKDALGYAMMYAHTEAETAEFALLLTEVYVAIEEEAEKMKKENNFDQTYQKEFDRAALLNKKTGKLNEGDFIFTCMYAKYHLNENDDIATLTKLFNDAKELLLLLRKAKVNISVEENYFENRGFLLKEIGKWKKEP